MAIETIRFLVKGKVQGVFYRQSALEQAVALGLTGYVRNLPDGSVEALAQGSSGQVDQFREWLHKGPPMARVDEVIGKPVADAGSYRDFQIWRG